MVARRLAIGAALDAGALVVAFGLGSLVVFGHPLPWVAQPGVWPLLSSLTAGLIVGLTATRPAANTVPRPSYGRALTTAGIMLATTAVLILFMRPYWSRPFVAVVAVVWLGGAFSHRLARRRRPWTEPIVVITGEKSLVGDLSDAPHVEVVGVLDPGGVPPADPPRSGTTVVVDLRSVLSDEMARFVSSCSLAGYGMRSLVSTYEENTGRLPIVHLLEGWELTVPLRNRRFYPRIKRVIDTVLVIATAPAWLALSSMIALAVRVDSRGPAIFAQQRIGRDGSIFTLYKFRTMKHRDDDPPRFAAPKDDRLTRFGRLLRLTRMDELPQLVNVLRGDLSLVGPRPEQGPFVEEFGKTIPFYAERHLVRPGITGWAQVNFGYADSEADTIEKLSYDLYYVKHVSVSLDLEILARSIWTVLSGRGAR